jgi:hypothetical protein
MGPASVRHHRGRFVSWRLATRPGGLDLPASSAIAQRPMTSQPGSGQARRPTDSRRRARPRSAPPGPPTPPRARRSSAGGPAPRAHGAAISQA